MNTTIFQVVLKIYNRIQSLRYRSKTGLTRYTFLLINFTSLVVEKDIKNPKRIEINTRENHQQISRDYEFRGPHYVSYKVAFSKQFHLITHFYHLK